MSFGQLFKFSLNIITELQTLKFKWFTCKKRMFKEFSTLP